MPIERLTEEDRKELLESLHPRATRMHLMLSELLSEDGMRISDHGRRKHTYDAFQRVQGAAICKGFIIERLPAGPHSRMRNVIIRRWASPYRDGIAALLVWAHKADLEVAAVAALPRYSEAASNMLALLGRQPRLACVLPPLPPLGVRVKDNVDPWQSWFATAHAVLDAIIES